MIPYGVYDTARNEAWVSVGVDHDTSELAVATLERWWREMGKKAYPDATELLVTANGGGSNSPRTKLWRVELTSVRAEVRLEERQSAGWTMS